jgi:hypothetical protein
MTEEQHDNAPKEINERNCRLLLAAFMEKHQVTVPRVCRAIGCSTATLGRILSFTSLPTAEFMKQTGIMIGIGIEKYEKLSKAEKEKISDVIGAGSATAFGFAGITAAVSASGTVAGLSAAGISSGLYAIGALVGGGMATGVVVAAAIPLAAGAAGYAIIKGVKFFFSERELTSEKTSPRWEIPNSKLPADPLE